MSMPDTMSSECHPWNRTTPDVGFWAFFTLATIHAVAVMSPGPTFVVQLRTSITEGATIGAVTAFGFGIGAAIWAAAALLGLAALFQVAPAALTVLKVAGGLFLAFIGIVMWRHAPEPAPMDPGAARTRRLTPWRALRLGILTSLANPKVVVFFGAVFVGLVPATATWMDFAIILALIIAVESTWYACLGVAFAAPPARRAYARAKTWIDRAFGGVLTAMGLRIMVN
ncbi:LysE family translocator [Shimia ponticola]|uniref:LysE family translocator n=1 Tax=Shimia ponticola TaxID=2582893 RepID=UPI0021026159|nr:LysE family translocator [Shimia ponticola]